MPTNTPGSVARNTLMQVPHAIYADLTFEDGEKVIGVIPDGSLILKNSSNVNVTEAFDAGTTNTVHVGVEDDNDLYASALTLTSVAQVAFDEFSAANIVDGDAKITCTYNNTGTAPTAGSARVVVMYLPPNG